MCVSAMVMARDHNVQFRTATLRSWAKDRRKGDVYRHRRVYAWLVKSAVPTSISTPRPAPISTPIPTPIPASLRPPTPITTPVTHHPEPILVRRPLFVRVPSKVA
jgi:hypothetical protein